MRPTFRQTLNIEGYRRAKARVAKSKLGVYPVLKTNLKYKRQRKDKYEYVFFLMHKKRKPLKECCAEFSLPVWAIVTSKKKRYGYYVLRLTGPNARLWLDVLEGKRGWFKRTWEDF